MAECGNAILTNCNFDTLRIAGRTVRAQYVQVLLPVAASTLQGTCSTARRLFESSA